MTVFLLALTLSFCLLQLASSFSARPIDGAAWPDKFPAKDHCSRCGLCETSFVQHVKDACALLPETGMARLHGLEQQVHGRVRRQLSFSDATEDAGNDNAVAADEGRFGVMYKQPMQLVRGVGVRDAQWTGVVTGIALSMLEADKVDAVVCIANAATANLNKNTTASSSSWAQPEPILARTTEDVLRGRGVKPALAPSLKVLDEIQKDDSIQRLLFCGVGCAVQAFRAVQDKLNLQQVYVLGTNCVDNSPTAVAAENFVRQGLQIPLSTNVVGYEFMQDLRVHVKTTTTTTTTTAASDKRGYVTKPYFSLPGTIAAPSIATSCLACFDYTNGLADIVVGYMGAPLQQNRRMDESDQTLTVRNARGEEMVEAAVQARRIQLGEVAKGEGSYQKQAVMTVQADSIVQAMLGKKIPKQGLPVWAGEIMAFVLRRIGPKGVNFARYSIDYHILRNYLHVVNEWDQAIANKMMPTYARDIVQHYVSNEPDFQSLVDQVADMKKVNRTYAI